MPKTKRSAARRSSKAAAREKARTVKPKARAAATAKRAKAHPVSPLAPKQFPKLPEVAGVRLATAQAGIKYAGRTDMLLALMPAGTAAAGVFTTSKAPSAAVDWCRTALGKSGGASRALVVNSGNANAFTGAAGAVSARATADAAASAAGCSPQEILIASTGVIGEPLPHARIVAALPGAAAKASPALWPEAARAIMTTDTFPKAATAKATIDGVPVTINGIAKGSGMIAPDLATMLAFVFTDAKIAPAALQTLLMLGVRDSFNCITVDSDTSTSDTVLLFATGQAGHAPVARPGDRRLAGFKEALDGLLLDLALQVVRDGEGAQKLITIDVTGAESIAAARQIGLSIANSPLVKTAIAGGDANWGRIVMAVGKSGQKADRDRLSIRFGGKRVATNGARDPSYDEAAMSAYMKGDDIRIAVDVGSGNGASRVYTCDLTHGYISINADYRS